MTTPLRVIRRRSYPNLLLDFFLLDRNTIRLRINSVKQRNDFVIKQLANLFERKPFCLRHVSERIVVSERSKITSGHQTHTATAEMMQALMKTK
jgi:hypothetical protein